MNPMPSHGTPYPGAPSFPLQFKIGLITYKILNQGQPVYLKELIHPTPLPEIQGEVPPNSSSFKPPLSIVEFTNQ